MCTFFGKKLSYDLNSYYWRVVMTNKDNMMITIMIVKAVIKKKMYLQPVSVRVISSFCLEIF